ncbi:LytR/AlgR family response regulator transcription factor [Enterococcus sp. AZ109]|uniref:LytR/AlgR family response regulator transcription factor n=1 Tax=Enterococcus sp. AZ109 TaxID=2774634 RepID=UPI003F20176E
MAIKVYIAEDHLEQRNQIVQSIKNYRLFSDWELEIASVAASGEELLASIDRENQWNIYFLDINLAAEAEISNGFVVAQEIRNFDPFGFIVFITVRSELSFLTFQYRVQALDFIIKDPAVNIQERVHTCLKTVEQRLSVLDTSQTIKLNTGNEITSFIIEDILYIASNKGHILSLHTKQKEYQIYQETLNHLEEQLEERFIRCHRGFLINTKAIRHISRDFSNLILEDGTTVPVSVRKRSALKTLQSKYVSIRS